MNSPTMSPSPFFHFMDLQEKSFTSVGQSANPVPCFATRMAYFAPISCAARIHCSGSRRDGFSEDGGISCAMIFSF